MRGFINLFVCSVTEDSYLILIFPKIIVVSELDYNANSDKHEGTSTIPNIMQYNSISGTKSISTAANFDDSTKKGYLGILFITVYDGEGSYDDFVIILLISGDDIDLSLVLLIVLSVIGLIFVVSLSVYFVKRGKRRKNYTQPSYGTYSYRPSYEEQEDKYSAFESDEYFVQPQEFQIGNVSYCPYCGKIIKTPKKFCPNCGESIVGLM